MFLDIVTIVYMYQLHWPGFQETKILGYITSERCATSNQKLMKSKPETCTEPVSIRYCSKVMHSKCMYVCCYSTIHMYRVSEITLKPFKNVHRWVTTVWKIGHNLPKLLYLTASRTSKLATNIHHGGLCSLQFLKDGVRYDTNPRSLHSWHQYSCFSVDMFEHI